jgi:hypothetical protein
MAEVTVPGVHMEDAMRDTRAVSAGRGEAIPVSEEHVDVGNGNSCARG